MEQIIETLRVTRNNIINLVDGLSNDQLNRIPVGFNNNLVWNMGHVLVTQQLLVYRLSGLPGFVTDEVIERYRKGSKPQAPVSMAEISEIKNQLMSVVDKTKEDWTQGEFLEYKEYPASFGIVLKNAGDAMQFNNSHEALHLGYMMAMKKLV